MQSVACSPSLSTYLAGGLCGLALLGVPGAARAAEPSAAERATARTLAQEGYDALRAERYSIAVDRFKRADALVHAPTLLRDLARAQVGLGHLVDAHETYRQIIREGVPAKSPASWAAALEEAKREAAALEQRLPSITLSIKGPAHPKVTLDGTPIAENALDSARRVDPGRHELHADADGYLPTTKRVELKEGEALLVTLDLEKEAAAAAPTLAPTPKPRPPARPVSVETREEPGWRKPAMVGAFALGGAGIVVGSVTGIMAMTKHSELVSDCPNRTCGPDQQSSYNDFRTMSTVSTIGFAVGGVGLGTGMVLLLLKPKASIEQQPTALNHRSPARGASWSPFVGVGAAGVRGSF